MYSVHYLSSMYQHMPIFVNLLGRSVYFFPRKLNFHFIVWLIKQQKYFSFIFDFLSFENEGRNRKSHLPISLYEDSEKSYQSAECEFNNRNDGKY